MGRWPHSTHPISIHAPRVGSDFAAAGILLGWRNFNPRSPCGERRPEDKMEHLIRAFQSTLPVWGATLQDTQRHDVETFQSTLPVWGATGSILQSQVSLEFQSTLPVWGATALGDHSPRLEEISIHAPRVGSDSLFKTAISPILAFQSTLPVWGATASMHKNILAHL